MIYKTSSDRKLFRAWLWGGLVGGIGAAVSFVALHGVVIVPIWTSVFSLGSFVRVVAGGLFTAWVAVELLRDSRPTARAGIKLGALFWSLVLPATIFGLTASLLGFRRSLGVFEPLIELVLTVICALLVARRWSTLGRGKIALSVTSIVFVGILGGPFPLFVSRPALGLLLGLLPIFLLAGGIQGHVASMLFKPATGNLAE